MDDVLYSDLRRQVETELRIEPLSAGQSLQLQATGDVDGRIVATHLCWSPAKGFFIPGEPEIPVLSRAQGVRQNRGQTFMLADWVQAQHRVRTAPATVRTIMMMTESEGVTTLDCGRTLVIRFFSGKEVTIQMVVGDTINNVKAHIQQLIHSGAQEPKFGVVQPAFPEPGSHP